MRTGPGRPSPWRKSPRPSPEAVEDDHRTVPPGGVIGIVGGGQLGRMAALAAASLGYRCHVFCPQEGSPATEVACIATTGAYDDPSSLDAFASSVDVITYEFENLPVEAFRRMSARSPVRPHWRCLETTQNRVSEKGLRHRPGVCDSALSGCHWCGRARTGSRGDGQSCDPEDRAHGL